MTEQMITAEALREQLRHAHSTALGGACAWTGVPVDRIVAFIETGEIDPWELFSLRMHADRFLGREKERKG